LNSGIFVWNGFDGQSGAGPCAQAALDHRDAYPLARKRRLQLARDPGTGRLARAGAVQINRPLAPDLRFGLMQRVRVQSARTADAFRLGVEVTVAAHVVDIGASQ
jgi:hypothetical protein